ncbi:hypothetical protein BKA66DRAFT_552570 [Pyrenochaeta sp. MPI-SDFR-AT-0127]|nr:hypothetical protein BKA66DRAFT_552570 [Pyrenochaeta sp. MPI-SDFR-AT-0127]
MATNAESSDTAQSNDPKASIQAEWNSIKGITAIFREIYNTIFEEAEIKPISRVERGDPLELTPYFTTSRTYTIFYDANPPEQTWVKGKDAFPPGTSRELKMGILKLHTCDMSVHLLHSHLTKALETIGARVDWGCVAPKPHILIKGSSTNFHFPLHSTFCITSSTGNEFIADFTIEQLGYEESGWFCNKDTYLENCTMDARWRAGTVAEADMLKQSLSTNDFALCVGETIRVVCNEIDWKEYEKLSEPDRELWLQARMTIVKQRAREENRLNDKDDE